MPKPAHPPPASLRASSGLRNRTCGRGLLEAGPIVFSGPVRVPTSLDHCLWEIRRPGCRAECSIGPGADAGIGWRQAAVPTRSRLPGVRRGHRSCRMRGQDMTVHPSTGRHRPPRSSDSELGSTDVSPQGRGQFQGHRRPSRSRAAPTIHGRSTVMSPSTVTWWAVGLTFPHETASRVRAPERLPSHSTAEVM